MMHGPANVKCNMKSFFSFLLYISCSNNLKLLILSVPKKLHFKLSDTGLYFVLMRFYSRLGTRSYRDTQLVLANRNIVSVNFYLRLKHTVLSISGISFLKLFVPHIAD